MADFDADFKDHLEATANALIAAYDDEYYGSYDSSSGDDYSYEYYRAGARPKKKHRVQNHELSPSLDHDHGHRVLQDSNTLLMIAEVRSEIVGTGSDGTFMPLSAVKFGFNLCFLCIFLFETIISQFFK